MKNIITLIGLMGVGKTAVASELSSLSNYQYIDSDAEIISEQGISINEIFSKFGEKYFRNIEQLIINKIIEKNDNIIIATGGGAFVNEKTANILLKNSLVVWLKCDVDVITKRISEDNSRPLLNNKEITTTLKQLLEKRTEHYQKANITIDTSNKTTKEVAEIIWQKYLTIKS